MRYFILIILFQITLSASAQSKLTWNTASDISGSTDGMHPRMCLDRKGNALLVYGRMSDEALMFTRWNGTSFTTPVKLNPTGFTVATASWMGPNIASKGDTVYIVFRQTPETTDTSKHIYILTSFNGGVSFSEAVQVDFIGDSLSRFPTVTVDENGQPIVAYMKFNMSFMESKWVVTRSNDYGETFSVDTKASGYSGNGAEVCDCCPGSVLTSGNTTVMLYRDNLKNIRDIWAGISTDNGKSFSSGYNADKNKWMIMSCPSSGPDGVIIGDSLYSVFMSGGSGKYRTYLSRSSISQGFPSVTRLSEEVTGLGQQNYPRIDVNGKAGAIVWRQNISGTAQLPILFTDNIINGFPSSYELVDGGDVTNTDVAVSNGKVFVVWQDDKSGTIKYRIGNFSPVTGIEGYIEKTNFSIYPNPASTKLNVQLETTENTEIKIVNLLGETVLYIRNPKNAAAPIDISGINSGIYFIQVVYDNRLLNKKFIKL